MAEGQPGPGRTLKLDPLARILRRAPVASMLVMPYGLLFIPMALINNNPDTAFMVKVLAIALLPAAAFELALRTSRRGGEPNPVRAPEVLAPLAKAVSVVGFGSVLLNALMGSGTIADQVSGVSSASSPVVALTSLFLSWQYLGLALILAAFQAGQLDRRQVLLWSAAGLAVNALKFGFTLISAPLFTFMITCLFLLIYTGIIRTRQAVAAMLVVLLLWPVVHTARDQARASLGIRVSSASATERLRYDLQITRAAEIQPPLDVGQPRMGEIARYGLVPRVLDQGRPVISTGVRIASYLAGQPTPWAFTFLPVTTLYVFEGPQTLALFYLGIAVMAFVLLRNGTRQGPIRMMVFVLLLSGPLGWFATFPDSTIGSIQGIVSAVPIVLVLWTAGARSKKAPEPEGAPQESGGAA